MRRSARALVVGGLVVAGLAVGVAACGGTTSSGATLEATRPPGKPPTPTEAPAAGTTTTTVDSSDVTLAGGDQITAVTTVPRATAPSSTVPIVAPVPAGFARAADPAGIVSVAVPSAWTIVPLDDRALEDLANQGGANFPPETRQQLQAAVAQAGQYMKVLAVGRPGTDGTAPTLSAIVTPGVLPISALKAVYPQQVTALGGELVEQADLTVDGRPALRVRIRLKLVAGSADSIQVLIPVEGNTVIVSIAGVEPALLDQMIAAIVLPKR
jgi:hypothetical protein